MAGYLRDMVDLMKERRESKAREPKSLLPDDPQERPIVILEQDAAFSDDEMLEAIDYFMADRNLARAYAALQIPRTRTGFLQRRLAKLRGK
jgi:hypothetical protein